MGKHKTRLVGWHPSSPAAVDWLDAEIARRGGGRGAQSAILDEALEKTMNGTTTTRLTDADRRLVARARALAGTATTDEMRAVTGTPPGADWNMVNAEALGVAKYLLAELAVLAERLGGPVPDEEDNHG